MVFLSLSYIHTLIALLTAFVFTLYNFLKTKKLDVKKIAAFLISILIVNSLFYLPFLKSLYSDQVVLKFFLLVHLIVNVLVLFLYILYYDKSVFGAKFQNLLLLSSVVVFGQVYNISNFIELEKLRKEQMVVKDKIYQSSNKDLFFGPYISLPNGIYEYQIRYESKEDLNYKVTLLSGRLLRSTGVLRTGNSVESGRLLIENNIGVNLEFIIFNNVQTKDQTFIYEYKIYPVHILEHFLVSILCHLIISLVVYLLLRISVLIVGEYVFRFEDFERHFSVLFSCLITATILIWTASVIGLVTKSEAIYVLLLLWLFSLVFFLSFLLLLRLNAIKYLTIFVVVLAITIGTSINFGLPQINIYYDEIDIVRGIVSFLMFPNLFHSIEWPHYFYPHHYSHIHLSYVVMYPLSLVANLVYPEYGISFFEKNPDMTLIVARFISMIFSVFSVIALFALAREIFENVFVAAISSLLLGIAPMFFHMSHVAKTDTAIIFAIIASMYFSVLFGKRNDVKYLFASLFFAAMAASYKVNYASLLIIPAGVYVLSIIRSKILDVTRLFTTTLMSVIVFVVSFLVFIPNFLVIPDVIVNRFFYETGEGSFTLDLGLYFYVYQGLIIGSGVIPFLLFLLSLILVMKNEKFDRVYYLVLILLFGAINLIGLLSLSSRELPRYSNFFIPIIALLSSYSVYQINRALDKSRIHKILFNILIFLPVVFLALLNKTYFLKPISTIEARKWILENIPSDSRIASFNSISYTYRIHLEKPKIDEFMEINKLENLLSEYDYILLFIYETNDRDKFLNKLSGRVELLTNFNHFYKNDEKYIDLIHEWHIEYYTRFWKIQHTNPTIEIYRVLRN